MAGGQLLEHRLRDKLAAQLGGITEANLPYGRPDVLTATAVFEVEPAKNWRHGVSVWPPVSLGSSPGTPASSTDSADVPHIRACSFREAAVTGSTSLRLASPWPRR